MSLKVRAIKPDKWQIDITETWQYGTQEELEKEILDLIRKKQKFGRL